MRRSRSEYNKAYYEQNKEELNRKKKERYEKDKAYRSGILRRAAVRGLVKSVTNRRKVMVVKHAGRFENVFSLAAMAKIAGRNPDTIYRMSWAGRLPKPIYKDKQGRGVYCESQVDFLRSIFSRIDSGETKMTYEEVGLALASVWDKRFSVLNLNKAIRRAIYGKKESTSKEKARTKKAIRTLVQEAYKDSAGRLIV